MIAWMLWSILVATLLSLAALGAERALGLYRRPRRWVWATAMAASLAAPIALVAFAPAPTLDLRPLAMPDSATRLTTQADPFTEADVSAGFAEWLQSRLPIAWALGTATLLGLLGVSAVQLARARRRWTVAEMSGVEVFETDDLGPAVIGLLNPRIAIPRWVRRLDPRLQELVVRHEVEHRRAGDPRLLVAGLLARALFPWCLPVWWQFRRLRLAIEIDCDRRVLSSGPSLADYGKLLLEVGKRSASRPAHAVGIFERRSHLERRLRSLRPGRPTHRLALTLALVVLSVGAVATGVALPPPDPPVRLSRPPDPGPPAEPVALIVTVGADHGHLRTIEELARLDPHRRDLGGYRIHGKEAFHETSHGCGITHDREVGVLVFHVDPGDPNRPLAGYCYLLLASSLEGVEVRSRVARFDPESGFRQASFDSPPECENCSPASALAALERAGVAACRFRVQPYLEADGTVRTLDVLASDDRCVPVLRRWAEGIRWTAGRQRGEPVEGWASPISGGREGSMDVVPAEAVSPSTTTSAPADTPPDGRATSVGDQESR